MRGEKKLFTICLFVQTDEGALLEPLRPSAMDGVSAIENTFNRHPFTFFYDPRETPYQVQMEDIFKDTLQQSEIKLEILSEPNMIAALDVRSATYLVEINADVIQASLFTADVRVEALFASYIRFTYTLYINSYMCGCKSLVLYRRPPFLLPGCQMR